MIYSEDDLIPLSYLSQYFYCRRRAGLLFLEEQWKDNVHTAEGTILHEKVHSGEHEKRRELVIMRGIPVRSLKLGLFGVADSVELYATGEGYTIPWLDGKWSIHPVEYKHGESRDELEYEVQICAQAVCLEEMINCKIDSGFIYYGADRRRKHVIFDSNLRALVTEGALQLHKMLEAKITPIVRKSRKCRECSMVDCCLPDLPKSTRKYLDQLLQEAWGVV